MVQSCALIGFGNEDHGDIKNVTKGTNWVMTAPTGMVLVQAGPFMRGEVGENPFNGKREPNNAVSLTAFYMDDTEITNVVYREFIQRLGAKVFGTDTDVDDEELEEGAPAEELEGIDEEFIMTKLYPDTNVWQNDFAHHMGDIMVEYYFEHPGFDDYPVVGVTWEAAKFFTAWRTKYLNDYRERKGLPPYPSFSLPTAAQWEYAARGGKELAKYPWGGPYIRDYEGNLRATFKSAEGRYVVHGGSYTSHVKKYPPNDYGLYDMAGNVAEWTLDAYNPASAARVWDLNPVYLDDEQPMKIVKGGSWKDISHFLQTGASDYEHKDTARSYIGFRCVMPYIGGE